MQKDKLKQILIYVIPFIAFIVIFGFALACGSGEPPIKGLSIPKEEQAEVKEIEEAEEEEDNVVSIGDTIPELKGYDNLSVTFLSWAESNIAIEGPYMGDTYYTCTVKPGMKFIIIFFEFKNNGIRAQETPYFNEGEITTAEKGYIYEMWSTGFSHDEEEYNRRESTEEEVEALIGNSGAYEKLLQEESVRGCVIFEIPKDLTPTEANINHMLFNIKLTQQNG